MVGVPVNLQGLVEALESRWSSLDEDELCDTRAALFLGDGEPGSNGLTKLGFHHGI
jgi:hypothetical protein